MPAERASGRPILCLGEAIVDLVSEAEGEAPTQVSCFRPHFGGALANVAVAAARAGAPAALAGGVGEDQWGVWLRDRLQAEGVELRWFDLVPGMQTPIAFVTFDQDGEPRFQVYGDGIAAGVRSLEGRLAGALAASSALVFGSNTLVGEPERALTLEARRLALEKGLPVLFDPNVRENRWRDLDRAYELCRRACADALVVRANLQESRLIAELGPGVGPEEAAEAICCLGARVAVVTVGPDGAIARGEAEARIEAPEVDVVSPLGAGDAFLGALASGVERRGWRAGAVADALGEAVEAGSAACAGWGALG